MRRVLGVLLRWAQVLRPGGTLLLLVPIALSCFDRGRAITALQHFISDHEHLRAGRKAQFRADTLLHYREWLDISAPALVAQHGLPVSRKHAEDLLKTPEQMSAEDCEIHFHTFTVASYKELLDYFCEQLRPDFAVCELDENGFEVIAVLKRR